MVSRGMKELWVFWQGWWAKLPEEGVRGETFLLIFQKNKNRGNHEDNPNVFVNKGGR